MFARLWNRWSIGDSEPVISSVCSSADLPVRTDHEQHPTRPPCATPADASAVLRLARPSRAFLPIYRLSTRDVDTATARRRTQRSPSCPRGCPVLSAFRTSRDPAGRNLRMKVSCSARVARLRRVSSTMSTKRTGRSCRRASSFRLRAPWRYWAWKSKIKRSISMARISCEPKKPISVASPCSPAGTSRAVPHCVRLIADQASEGQLSRVAERAPARWVCTDHDVQADRRRDGTERVDADVRVAGLHAALRVGRDYGSSCGGAAAQSGGRPGQADLDRHALRLVTCAPDSRPRSM